MTSLLQLSSISSSSPPPHFPLNRTSSYCCCCCVSFAPPKRRLRHRRPSSSSLLASLQKNYLSVINTRKSKPYSSSSDSSIVTDFENQLQEDSSAQLFEKLKNAERERVNKLEDLDKKANMQLERQLLLASCWSRALLTLRGKLKGTEWDPLNSHRITYSDFMALLNSNNVNFMEYANYGQNVSVILPYYKDGSIAGADANSYKEIVFRRHPVDRMPIDSWNDVWSKLHQQLVNVDVILVDAVPAELYSTIATAVIWSMRLGLAIASYVLIDNWARPIYAKSIPCDLGTASPPPRQPLKRRALGTIGKSR